jgi:hypothetical protein
MTCQIEHARLHFKRVYKLQVASSRVVVSAGHGSHLTSCYHITVHAHTTGRHDCFRHGLSVSRSSSMGYFYCCMNSDIFIDNVVILLSLLILSLALSISHRLIHHISVDVSVLISDICPLYFICNFFGAVFFETLIILSLSQEIFPLSWTRYFIIIVIPTLSFNTPFHTRSFYCSKIYFNHVSVLPGTFRPSRFLI